MEEMPEKFPVIMKDFINDLNNTFPEYKSLWWVYGEDTSEDGWKDLYVYCLTIYPERFFDILYQNEETFKEDSTANVYFLPNVDFKKLFYCNGVTKQTQTSIWKYLQLILFTVISGIKDKSEFGNTMNMFEGIDENELQEKLTEAMSGLGDFFTNFEQDLSNNINEGEKMMEEMFEKFQNEMEDDDEEKPTEMPEMPNPEDLHNHLKGLFGGKLGSLAKEIMEEFGEDLQETLGLNPDEFNDKSKPTDVFKKLMRHPDKLMKLVQKIQGKFQQKMDSGDLSQEDLMKEAGDMLRKMKEMGGNSKQMNEMFQNMAKGMGGSMGKNMKIDTNRLDRMMKAQDTKERIRAKLEKKRQEANFTLEQTNDPKNLVYRPLDGEKPEKSFMTNEEIDKLCADINDINVEKNPKPKSKSKNKKKKGKK